MHRLFHRHSPLRIFAISGTLTLLLLGGVWYELGVAALITALILVIIELTFSFDNAIINAKILHTMSPFWQKMFMTIGIFIAVFGMRVIFPVVLVMITSGLSWNAVVDLALNRPDEYSAILIKAHPLIASFGGMFLMMLGLDFFFETRDIHWLQRVEKRLQLVGRWWLPTAVASGLLLLAAALPANHHPRETLTAGFTGIITYLVVHGLTKWFSRAREKSALARKGQVVVATGMAGFMSFLYLEVLDASFSFDGVIGAFAITQDVILIAIGLGIGALWVRSLTLYMVRRHVLHAYRYLEHGAHYTILMLSFVLLGGLFFDIPEAVPGLFGIGIIGLSVWSSIRDNHKPHPHAPPAPSTL